MSRKNSLKKNKKCVDKYWESWYHKTIKRNQRKNQKINYKSKISLKYKSYKSTKDEKLDIVFRTIEGWFQELQKSFFTEDKVKSKI